MKNYSIFSLIAIMTLLWSCTDEAATNAVEKKTSAAVEVDTTDVFGSDEYEFVLPRPFALASSFQEAGMTYDASRMNPVENVDNYKTKGAQLINFGVYSTDLIYNILNDQPQQTMKYFNAVRLLADNFGMGSIFTEDDLAFKIEENISDRRALEDLLVDVHELSQEYLEDNDMRYLSAIQFSGAWIEGMYLVSFDIVNQDSKKVGFKLTDQMTLLSNTIKGLEAYPSRDKDINKVLNELKSLQEMYDNFESVKKTGGKGFPDLTDEDIKQIAEKIQEIRKLVIEL